MNMIKKEYIVHIAGIKPGAKEEKIMGVYSYERFQEQKDDWGDKGLVLSKPINFHTLIIRMGKYENSTD